MSEATALQGKVREASRFAELVELQPVIAGKEIYLYEATSAPSVVASGT
jgi:hypothetical protein